MDADINSKFSNRQFLEVVEYFSGHPPTKEVAWKLIESLIEVDRPDKALEELKTIDLGIKEDDKARYYYYLGRAMQGRGEFRRV